MNQLSKFGFTTNLLLCIIALAFCACNNDDGPQQDGQNFFIWEKIGLDGLKVNRLILKEDWLFAATEDGVYIKNIITNENFEAIGLQGLNVEDILVFSEDHIMASVADFKDEIVIHIASTSDRGNNWQVLDTNFGGGSIDPHIVWNFFKAEGASQTIYATSNYVVAKSMDGGISWRPIWGDWDQFTRATSVVAVNPLSPDEIWLGGQGAIEDGYLIRLVNEVEINRWLDLVPNPTTPKKIVFDAKSPQNIYVGFEGALIATKSNGQSWLTLIDEHESARFFNGISLSTQDDNTIYAAGWLKSDEPQPLILFFSNDGGESWKQEIFTNERFGGVEDMVLANLNNQDQIFLALNKGGVYRVKPLN